jgi:arabinose-5-phosphate isomerase
VTRALHGDLGAVAPDDIAILLSHSGESEELLKLLPPLRELAHSLIAITGKPESTLARTADISIIYGPLTEACPNRLAPSASTAVMMAIGDALALSVSEARQFGPADFARFHPAGSLGRKLATVAQFMRTGPELRLAPATATVREVFAATHHTGRRTGAILLTHPDGTLAGLFTDSDLAKLFEARQDAAFDGPIEAVMTRNPVTVSPIDNLAAAVELLKDRKFSELPVLDDSGRPVGMLDITDVIGREPPANSNASRPPLRLLPRGAG